MNQVQIVGRLTKDPELKQTANGVSVCKFTVAVNRRFKNAEGNYDADFINCVAWRQSAELICKYFAKGRMIGIVGSIQTRNYEDKEGKRVFITEVNVEEVHFVESRNATPQADAPAQTPTSASAPGDVFNNDFGFMPMPSVDDDLPF